MHKSRFTRIGFILAAAGSAVGLGNIWKFPYITGENGGGVFVLIYLLTVLFIGMAIFVAEVVMGANSHKDAVSTYETLAPAKSKKYWKFAGFSLITAFMILLFYPVVISWIFHYIVLSVTALPTTVQEAETVFLKLLKQDIGTQIFYFTITFVIVAYIISKGVKNGIEKINNILIPSLLVIIGILFLYAVSLDGFSQAVSFMFTPDFEKFNTNSIVVAVGHAFFTLSIGMVVIMTYASSLDKHVNIVKISVTVVFLDTLIAILAGLAIFAILFTLGHEPGKGPGLIFITLPATFYEMGAIGGVLSVAFFVALLFAALTSAISILEPVVEYLIVRKNMKRTTATYICSSVGYVLGLAALLSNTTEFSTALTFGSKNLFDWLDFISAAILLPIGGIFVAIFVGYFMDKEILEKTLIPYTGRTIYNAWLFSIKYIAPIAILVVLLTETGIWGFLFK